jgi:hypothetical protein
MNGFYSAALVTCAAVLSASSLSGIAQTLPPTQQALRDDERLRILRDELLRARGQQEDAIKQRADRLAAGDSHGAEEASQRQARLSADVEAIQREMALVSRPAPAPVHTSTISNRSTSSDTSRSTAWWDVYASTAQRHPEIVRPQSGEAR